MNAFGLLWFDDNPARTLSEKVQAACAQYAQKFGVKADTVYVHPSEAGTGLTTVMTVGGGTQIIADKKTLLYHYFAVREKQDDDTWESLGRGYIDYPEPDQTYGADNG